MMSSAVRHSTRYLGTAAFAFGGAGERNDDDHRSAERNEHLGHPARARVSLERSASPTTNKKF